MAPILAIALLTLRSAIRSRLVLCLLALLLAIIVLLPLTIQGDGTVAGLVQILLSYTLGLSGFMLALTTLWAGCASVAAEIDDKTLQLVATKPVSPTQLWLGKWIGLNLLNAALLAICGLAAYAMLNGHLAPGRGLGPDARAEAMRLLAAHAVLTPAAPDDRAEIDTRLAALIEREGEPPEGRAAARRTLARQIAVERNTVRPGGSQRWTFPGSAPVGPDLALTIRFATSLMGQDAANGRWLIGTPAAPDLITLDRGSVPRVPNTLPFTLDERWQGQPLVITYIDLDPRGATLLFNPADGLELFVPVGSFTGNYLRALLIQFGRLSFFAALGVTAGSMLSLPVASLVAVFLLGVVSMGSTIEAFARNDIVLPSHAADPDTAMSWSTIALLLAFKSLAAVLGPVITANPLDPLAAGRLIDLARTASGLLVQGLFYPLLLGALATAVLRRRELALPET